MFINWFLFSLVFWSNKYFVQERERERDGRAEGGGEKEGGERVLGEDVKKRERGVGGSKEGREREKKGRREEVKKRDRA